MPAPTKPFTVTAITRMIKSALEEMYPDIWIEGEISGYIHHSSGHRYFSLKDQNAVLKCAMWRSVGAYLKFEPENGQKILCRGDITVYEKGGQYQLSCKEILPVGIGPLELAFRQLHEKLSKEGLFDEDRKRALPEFPTTIGIVTSPTGAAIRDIVQIATRRNDTVQLIIYPAAVQGTGAEETIAAGIRYFNTREDIDLIICGRGGGSLEDLWPFNTEITVRAIVDSRIPVVSAVGHEIDITLSDLASDLRAPTPSAAAELAVWSKQEFKERINGEVYLQTQRLQSMVKHARQELNSLLKRPVFERPLDLVNQRRQYVDQLTRLTTISGKNLFERHKNNLSLIMSRLDTLSPLKTLARGYSVTRDAKSGKVVTSIKNLSVGTQTETTVTDGRFRSTINEMIPESN
jgi:exodeoxyribonuclease VII large subunit